MPFPSPVELVIILVIALLILGPGKLPDVGSALGKSIREFRKAATDVQEATRLDAPSPSAAPPAAAAPPPPANTTTADTTAAVDAASSSTVNHAPAGEPSTEPKP